MGNTSIDLDITHKSNIISPFFEYSILDKLYHLSLPAKKATSETQQSCDNDRYDNCIFDYKIHVLQQELANIFSSNFTYVPSSTNSSLH